MRRSGGSSNGGCPKKEFMEDSSYPAIFENQIMTVKEVAKLLKLSTKTVYKRVNSGEIPHKKIGDEIRFLLPELMSWMKGQDYV
jgi:excisionase family DNA binding protein